MNTIHHLSQYALQELKDSYSEHEIECICKIIYMDVLHYTNIDIHLRKNEILDESFINKFIGIVRLLKSGFSDTVYPRRNRVRRFKIQVNPFGFNPPSGNRRIGPMGGRMAQAGQPPARRREWKRLYRNFPGPVVSRSSRYRGRYFSGSD